MYLLRSDVTCTDCRIESDIIFVLDSSGSIGEQNFDVVKEWLSALMDR